MLLVGAGLGVPSLSGLCIPGSIVTILGLLLLLMIQNSFDLWSTWAYAWTLVVLVGTGAGLAIPFLLIAAGAALVAWNRVAQTSPSRQETLSGAGGARRGRQPLLLCVQASRSPFLATPVCYGGARTGPNTAHVGKVIWTSAPSSSGAGSKISST